jgi:hypothetical protein
MKKITFMPLVLLVLLLTGCNLEESKVKKTTKNTLFIGIDVSGSFTRTKRFKDAMDFLGEYIWAHLQNKGRLSVPKDLYVGGIGGNVKEDPQAFFPVHDFIGKTPIEITKKLTKEFANQKDNLTDFNTYFLRVKSIVKQKNLVLAPISIILITDGVPEIAGNSKSAVKQAYSRISVKPLEYLARNISIRILYAGPRVGNNWRTYVPTNRIRIWTVEPEVMYGWKEQKKRNGKTALWNWIADNIDLRIQSRGL